MTDTTISLPIAKDFTSIPAKGIKRIAGWLITAGAGFGAFLSAYSQAVEMAYCGPFQKPAREKKHGIVEDLDGRDPNW